MGDWAVHTGNSATGQDYATASAYLPAGILTPWQNALGKSTSQIATVMIIGASWDQAGSVVSNALTKGWFQQWRGMKRAAGYPTAGDYITPRHSSNWSGNNAPNGWPFVFDRAADSWSISGLDFVPLFTPLNNAGPPLFHYVHRSTDLGFNGLSFRIYYWDAGAQDGGASAAGQNFVYNLNGGANQTSPNYTGSNTIKFVTLDNSTPGWANAANNTINFVSQSAASTMRIMGVYACPTSTIATFGIAYVWYAHPSNCLGDLGRTDQQFPAQKLERLIGPSNAAPPFTPSASLSPPFAPDLLILGAFDDGTIIGGLNGVSGVGGVNPTIIMTALNASRYGIRLRRINAAARQKTSGCTIVDHIPGYPDGLVSDVVLPVGANAGNAWPYADVIGRTALTNGHAIVNSDNVFKESGLADGRLIAGNPHYTDAGGLEIATRFTSFGF